MAPTRWLPSRRDLVIALAVLMLSQTEVWWYGAGGGGAVAAVTLGTSALALAWRNRAPVFVVVAVWTMDALCASYAGEPFSATSVLTALLSFFAVGAMSGRAVSTTTLAAFMVLTAAATDPLTVNNYLSIALSSVAVPWLLGLLWLRHRTRLGEARRQQEAAADAVAQERLRLARELHDVVSHNVGMIAVQAGAAEVLMDADPQRSRESLRAIESGAKATLLELRQLLGVLRESEPDPTSARSSLGDLQQVVAPLVAAGVTVVLHNEGTPRPLPREVDVTAYRVVQESLTNVVAHAGPCSVSVSLAYRPDELVVEICDDGAGRTGTSRGGYGLVGLRERVAVLGGRFEAGPRDLRGFRVQAVIPVTSR
jgi:signal transduction histidine kinase